MNLPFGQSFACPSCDVLPGAGLTLHANHRNSPHLIGGAGREVALQQVRCNGQIVFAVGGDHELPLSPGLDTRAKYAVAFPKMSRSILKRAFSARGLASSICSGRTGLSPAPLS